MAAKLFFTPIPAVLSRGLPAAGAQIFFYLTGTLTETPAYTASDLLTSLSNPVVADGAGQLPPIYLNDTITYRIRITDKDGILIPGCDIDPYTPGTLISLQGAKGDPGGNLLSVGAFTALSGLLIPLGTDLIQTSDGAQYVADAAVDAAFVTAHPTWSKITSNGRGFRLYERQDVWFEMFGGKADVDKTTGLGTDNLPAWLAARDFIHYFRDWPSGNYYYKPSITLNFRAKQYYFSDAIDLTDAAYVIRGSGNGGFGLGCTQFYIAAGKCGMLLQSWDTQGTNGTQANINTQPYNHGASSSLISDIVLVSLGGTLGTFQHGVVLKCQATFERVFANNFAGDGFHAAADVNTAGNANSWKLLHCGANDNGGSGLYLDGGDANAGYSIGFQAFRNAKWGIYDSSFLGNHHFFFQTDGNGVNFSGPSWVSSRPSTFTNRTGRFYRVRPGQEVAASTADPATSPGQWIDHGAGSTSLGGTWASGQTFCTGGAFYADDPNARCVFAGYQESDQASGWLDSGTSTVLPGFSSAELGSYLAAVNFGLVSNRIGARIGGATSGHVINALLGTALNAADDSFFSLGNATDESVPWTWFCDSSNHVYQKYNGADGSGSYEIFAPGNPVGFGAPRGIAIQGINLYSGTAAPTTGTWTRGSIVKNQSPAVGSPKGWVCTVAGTPGTWVSEGNL